ncbi:MAG: DNA-processing protein DprA [Thomasclavelia sp.]|nr:DNA-processing protein DprA [Thomasclavelia sp.]
MVKNQLNIDSLSTLLYCMDCYKFVSSPLTNDEWYTIERIIKIQGLTGPGCLLNLNKEELVSVLGIDKVVADKITSRKIELFVLLDYIFNLDKKGILISTKYESTYPTIMLTQMKKKAPLYFYYKGNVELLGNNVSIVGLQNVDKESGSYCKRLVDKINNHNYILVSNDNEGVDKECLRYDLNHGGSAVLFVCDDFNGKCEKYSRYLKNGRMLIMCTESIEGSLSASKLLDRNVYVSGLSKYQVIVSTKINGGLSWFGAIINLHNKWNKLLVVNNGNLSNDRLIEMHATPIEINDIFSDDGFEKIYLNNKPEEESKRVDIDQMSMYEIIGEVDE